MYRPTRSGLDGLVNRSDETSRLWTNAKSAERKRDPSRNKYFETIRNITLAKQAEHIKTKQEHLTLEQRNEEKKRAQYEQEVEKSHNDLSDWKRDGVSSLLLNQKSRTSALNTSERRSQLRISNQVTAVDLG